MSAPIDARRGRDATAVIDPERTVSAPIDAGRGRDATAVIDPEEGGA